MREELALRIGLTESRVQVGRKGELKIALWRVQKWNNIMYRATENIFPLCDSPLIRSQCLYTEIRYLVSLFESVADRPVMPG